MDLAVAVVSVRKGNTIGNIECLEFSKYSPFFDLEAKLADGTRPAYQYAEFSA